MKLGKCDECKNQATMTMIFFTDDGKEVQREMKFCSEHFLRTCIDVVRAATINVMEDLELMMSKKERG